MSQGDLFGAPAASAAAYEVHEHVFIDGPRSRYAGRPESMVVHSHPGGNVPHAHPQTGPACYTIDKDEWSRVTGLKGGGRKRFTKTVTGEQLPLAALESWQTQFDVVVCDPLPARHFGQDAATGPGEALPARMAMGFGMKFRVIDGRRR
ncbi:MAG TPA: hypothetical protein VJ890_03660 [Vineibacter sp.]|nr:hypothetical protein [Vineibacter sp.]